MRKLALLLAGTLYLSSSATAQTNVADTLAMQRHFFAGAYHDWSWNDTRCVALTWASFPDRASPAFGHLRDFLTYYRVFDGEGNPLGPLLQPGYLYDITNNNSVDSLTTAAIFGIPVPPGHRAVVKVVGTAPCNNPGWPDVLARAAEFYNSLSGPWYVRQWLPSDAPVALFEWEQLGAVDPPFVSTRTAVSFDGSFESGQSLEAEPTGPKPVVSYAWDFGDGNTTTGAVVDHTFADAGTYSVKLTVTDDDGQTAETTHVVEVSEAILEYRIREDLDVVALGDTVTVRLAVRNAGAGIARNVKVPRVFDFTYSPAPIDQPPTLGEALLAADTLTIDINPGDSVTVEQKYVVTATAKTTVDSELRDITVEMEPFVIGLSGEDEAGGDAVIRNLCELPDCSNTFLVGEPASLAVNSPGDLPDSDTSDESCDTGQTIDRDGTDEPECTLRAALETAAAQSTVGDISFDIPGSAPHTIAPASALPAVAAGVVVDGATQPGYVDEPLARIDGSAAGAGVAGLTIAGDGATVSALAIDGFDGDGLLVEAPNVTITRMHIGLTAGNAGNGIRARGSFENLRLGIESDVASGNVIGGSGANGVYLEGPDDVALSKNAQQPNGVTVVHTQIGTRGLQAKPNAGDGLAVRNLLGSLFKLNTIVNSGENGVDIEGGGSSSNVFVENDVGVIVDRTTQEPIFHPAGNGANGVLLRDGATNNLLRLQTLMANAGYAMRMISASQNAIHGSAMGVMRNMRTSAQKRGSVLAQLANGSGGVCLEDSPNNQIGVPGSGNIIGNNGTSQSGSGVFVTGSLSTGNLIQGNAIGTDADGTTGIGNGGSGIHITGGASGNTIGGDDPALGNIIGGNGEHGINLEDHNETAIAHNMIGAFLKDAQALPVGNGLSGVILRDVARILATDNTLGANNTNGIEVHGSQSTQNVFRANNVGAVIDGATVYPAGNGANGISIHTDASVNLIEQATILSNQLNAISIVQAKRNRVVRSAIGNIGSLAAAKNRGESGAVLTVPVAQVSPAVLATYANGEGGIYIEDAPNNEIGVAGAGNLIANSGNGTNGGIVITGARAIGNVIQGNAIGTDFSGTAGIGNNGPGILIANGATETTIGSAARKAGATVSASAASANIIASNLGAAIKLDAAELTRIVGNTVGTAPDGSTPLDNTGDDLSLKGSKLVVVAANKLRGSAGSALRAVQSANVSMVDNVIEHFGDGGGGGGGGGDEPAIVLDGARDFVMGTDPFGLFESDEPGNTVVAHELVHADGSSRVLLRGTSVSSPAGSDGAGKTLMQFLQSTDITIGALNAKNEIELDGGDGIAFASSTGVVRGNSIVGGNVGLSFQDSELVAEQTALVQQINAINAIRSRLDANLLQVNGGTGTGPGIRLEDSFGSIENSTIAQNGGDGIWLTGSSPTIKFNDIADNTGDGVVNTDPAITVDARENWWGDATGPSGEGPGEGDGVSMYVDYADWLFGPIGLILSSEQDSLTLVPGDAPDVTFAIQNLRVLDDTINLTVTDDAGWVADAPTSVALDGLEGSFDVALSIPPDATGESTVTVLGVSQTDPSVSDSIVVVVSTVAPVASLPIDANQANVTLSHTNSLVAVLANTSSIANTINLYERAGAPDQTIADDRVLADDGSVVRALEIADREWALIAEVPSSSAGKRSSSYTFEVCLSRAGLEATLTELARSVVVYRPSSAMAWRPMDTGVGFFGGATVLCATGLTDFGFFALASAVPATPSAPTLVFPSSGLDGVATAPVFRWGERSGAVEYELQVATDSLFLRPVAAVVSAGASVDVDGLAVSSTYHWRVRSGGQDAFGPWSDVRTFTTSSTGVAVEESVVVPSEIELAVNYPNPFSHLTTIVYQLPEPAEVKLEVFDVQGRLVRRLVDRDSAAGEHQVVFEARGLASGLYFYRLRTPRESVTRSMILTK